MGWIRGVFDLGQGWCRVGLWLFGKFTVFLDSLALVPWLLPFSESCSCFEERGVVAGLRPDFWVQVAIRMFCLSSRDLIRICAWVCWP